MTSPLRPLAVSLTAAALMAPLTWPAATAATAHTRGDRPTTHRVEVGSNPYAVAVSQRLGKAYVVNDGSVSTISLSTRRQLDEFGTGGYHGQNAIALVRRASRAYVTNMDSKDLVVFDTGTDQVTGTVAVGAGATDVVKVASPDGQQAYVGYLAKRHLTVVSTRSATVTGQVRLPAGVQTLTSTPGGHHVWAGSTTPGRIYVVSSSTGKRVRTVNVDRSGPVTSIAFAPGGRRAWVAGLAGVSVVDVSTGRTIRFLPILHLFTSKAPNMGAVAFSRSGRYALVENSTFPDEPRSGQVTAVNARTFRIAWRVRTGAEPLGLAVDTARDIAYTPDYADDTVTWFRVRR